MRLEHHDGIYTVSLDQPYRLNALDEAEMNALSAAIADASSREDARVIVLQGDGRAFSAGVDLATAGDLAQPAIAGATIDAANTLVQTIVDSPTPVVTLARGVVAGVAVPIALAADLVLCDEDTAFLLAFTKVGLMPDGGTSALVAASIGRARTMRMALLAEPLTASDAWTSGLVSHVLPTSEFDAQAATIIERLRTGPRVAFGKTKHAINQATLVELPAAFELERTGQIGLLGAADFAEGASAFQDKRAPAFTDGWSAQG
jgi:enoyl-CoA hydratase